MDIYRHPVTMVGKKIGEVISTGFPKILVLKDRPSLPAAGHDAVEKMAAHEHIVGNTQELATGHPVVIVEMVS